MDLLYSISSYLHLKNWQSGTRLDIVTLHEKASQELSSFNSNAPKEQEARTGSEKWLAGVFYNTCTTFRPAMLLVDIRRALVRLHNRHGQGSGVDGCRFYSMGNDPQQRYTMSQEVCG